MTSDDDDLDDICDLCGRFVDECFCDECGMLSDGTCTLAGTEFCDFECTFRDR